MKVYFPTRYEDVPSSHGDGVVYRVSCGIEHWDDEPQRVCKVQVVYDGRVSGRRSPSFPIGADDWERGAAAMERIRKGEGKSGRRMISQ
jgi:hypothetical protein